MVRDQEGNWVEPSVWDIDDSEKAPHLTIKDWLCMGVAVGATIILIPFYAICLFVITRRIKPNVKVVTPSIKPTLP